MARISTPQAKAKDSDDDQQWEDFSDNERVYRSRSPSTTRSGSFKGTASPARTRRSTRQRAAFTNTPPRKLVHGDFRSPVRARRDRGFVVELPPQEVLGTPVTERSSSIKPLFQEPTGYSVPYRSSAVELPLRQPMGTPIPQPRFMGELPSKGLAGTPGPDVLNIATATLLHVLSYVAEVFTTVVRIMKFPISIALAVIVCAYALTLMSEAIKSALAPICAIPVVSLLCPAPKPRVTSHPPNSHHRTPQWADFPSLLNVESKTLEALLDETVEGPGLALEIKKAEMATSDLVTLVRVSKLNSREALADSLNEFVKDARKVGRGLTRFSSRVGGAVDNIIAVNDYALHHIEGANSRPSGLSLRRLWGSSSEAATKQVVTRTFTEAMDALSANMQRLVLEAEVSVSDLNKLEEHLKSIHEVVSREDSSISAARDELLAQLWTILGGNKAQLKGMDEHRALLNGVGEYRKRALAHVVAALQTLETMAEDMEELRERVAAPELVGDAIPIDVHMKSIRSGLERLKGRRTGAKQLEEQIVSRILGSVDGVKVAPI